jgi:hypothetical protein
VIRNSVRFCELDQIAAHRSIPLDGSVTRPTVWSSAISLNMRLLIQVGSEGLAASNKHPAVLNAPAILLRTVYSANSDDYWRCRFASIQICKIPGDHDITGRKLAVYSMRLSIERR